MKGTSAEVQQLHCIHHHTGRTVRDGAPESRATQIVKYVAREVPGQGSPEAPEGGRAAQEAPEGSPTAPEAPGGSHAAPEAQEGSCTAPEAPEGSRAAPEAPERSSTAPEDNCQKAHGEGQEPHPKMQGEVQSFRFHVAADLTVKLHLHPPTPVVQTCKFQHQKAPPFR